MNNQSRKIVFISLIALIFINVNAREKLGPFTENETNSINVFKRSVSGVVNISSKTKRRGGFFYDNSHVPSGAGTGFVWNKKGYIVTNFHVVRNADKLHVTFHNNKEIYNAKLVGIEPKKDIAVLKLIKKPSKITNIHLGTSKNLLVGQKALAIGNPFGLDHTMTVGIISAVGRKVEGIGGVKIHDMIQTDAAINPGNSGGPLLDSNGRIIGMNTQILSGSGTSSGVGFAVPIDTVKRIVPQLIKHGKIIRPGLGIGILPEHIKMRFGVNKGIIISHVDPSGSAAKAGLQGLEEDRWGRIYLGDIILKINNKETNSYDDIYHALDNFKIGDQVEIEYLRDSDVKKINITLIQI